MEFVRSRSSALSIIPLLPRLAWEARDQEKWIPVFRPIARQILVYDHACQARSLRSGLIVIYVAEGRMRALSGRNTDLNEYFLLRQRALTRPSGTLSHCFATGEGERGRSLRELDMR